MIATILPGSTNFHAVGYNERKVSKGVARLLEIQNFGALGTFGKPTSEELVRYLQEYSSRNSRIQKAQFHVAISCKGHEQSESELLEFAHQYLKEMGYGEAGQPLLVYSHHDTDNTHLHIVTSRIAPDGKKIAHDHERRRSQEVIDRILGTNRKQKTGKDINDAKQYTFSSFAQFKSVMTSMGYETYQKDGIVFIKHGGKVQQKLPLSEIEALYRNGYRDRARCRQLRNIRKKYRDVSTNKEELQKELTYLKTVREKEVADLIKEARGFGDLSENSEYDEAKNEQGKLYSRIAEVEEILLHTVIVDENDAGTNGISIGCRVTVQDVKSGRELPEYKVVGSQEADPMHRAISEDSPFGKALMGAKEGDEVMVEAPVGTIVYRIVKIER